VKLPYAEPHTPIQPGERTLPEPPRRGEPGGPPCGVCSGANVAKVWEDEHWTVHPPVGGSLPGTVWAASKVHVDSFADLPLEAQQSFGVLCARVDAARMARGDGGRVHLYRWGDGGAHFHVWFMPRPLGMLEASGAMLPLWEDVLPNVTDEALRRAAEELATRMGS
jgi:diadenosine tetraphosphate (Ap4A) HIT family hydrolase